MQIKKPLRLESVFAAVCADVKKHFKNSLPSEWKDIVTAAVYPELLAEPDLHECVGLENFLKCSANDPDGTLKLLSFSRQCCAKYLPNNYTTKAALIKAILLRSWNAGVVEQNGQHRYMTIKEGTQIVKNRMAKTPKRIAFKLVPVHKLLDKEIAELISAEYHIQVKEADVKEARQSLSTNEKK